MHENRIAELTFSFSLKIIELYQELAKKQEYIISKQLLKSSTSVGANVMEAIAAYSRRDFAYKMTVANKEARETHYWLRLLNESSLIRKDLNIYLEEIQRIIRILTAIVKTTKESTD